MNKLKMYREEKKIDITCFANKVGISERHLRFIEKGERNPSLAVARKISKELKMSLEMIFDENDEK